MGCVSAHPPARDEPSAADKTIDVFRRKYGKCIAQALINPQVTGYSTQHPEDEACKPVVKCGRARDSSIEYKEPHQTILLFDWDDTLCPTTWARHASADEVPQKRAFRQKDWLRELSSRVVELLDTAQRHGKVVFVTNGRRGWVERSCELYLPEAMDVVKNIPVIYAMELVRDVEKEVMPTASMLTEAKARAMKAAVSEFYSLYEGQSWKNVVSIGDARYERDAVRQVTANRPHSTAAPKKCRTKAIKLLEKPTLFQISLQLSVLTSWLSKIVSADTDVSIDFGTFGGILAPGTMSNVRVRGV